MYVWGLLPAVGWVVVRHRPGGRFRAGDKYKASLPLPPGTKPKSHLPGTVREPANAEKSPFVRTVFFGTPDFAVPTLRALLESRHTVAAVVTQPDKPVGRGRKLASPPVKLLALEHGLPVLQPESVRTEEFFSEFAALEPDVAVVTAYGKILPVPVLETPKHGCLNVHASLLPAYRGAAPVQWAIINGETRTGVTIMKMDQGMDSGPIIATSGVDILEDDDARSLADLLALEGARLMVRVLDELEETGTLPLTEQDHGAATRAPLIKREMARIDWSWPAETIHCAVRGFLPWPKAYTTAGGKELKITGVEAVDPAWLSATAFHERVPPGMVVDIFKGRGFVVRTGGEKEALLVTKVQPPGRAEMGAIDFVNGGGISVGDVLGR